MMCKFLLLDGAPRNTTTVFHSLSSVVQTLSVQLAKRALVILLLPLARQYAMPALPLSRDSPDKVVMESFKKVAKKVHPDKGGATEDADRQREKERKRKGEREREDNKEENRTEKRRREGRGRKGKARRRGAGNHRHPSLVPLVRPHARASSRRDDLSQHTGQFGTCQKQMLSKLGGWHPATRQPCSTP